MDAYQHEGFTRPVIEDIARKHLVCPFEFSLDLALWVDCVICDYNYAFDPRVYLRRFFDDVSEPYVFLIDESHNFPDRAREMFSAELDKQAVVDLRQLIETALPNAASALGEINQLLLEKQKECENVNQEAIVEEVAPDELVDAVRKFVAEVEMWLVFNQQIECQQALLDLYYQCAAYVRVSENFDETYVSYFERDTRLGLLARLYCMDPAPHLKESLARSRAVIFFSATLLPLDYFERLLTGETNQPYIMLPSPFPEENMQVFIQNRIETTYRKRDAYYDDIASTIISVCEAQTGNYLVYFPSYAYMEAVVDMVQAQSPKLQLLVQQRGMSETEREDFLAQFSASNAQTMVAFAVMGGIFGEGIDLVGNRLIGAIIVGVGLPQLCLERNLIKTYFQEDTRQGFEYAYQFPGLNRVMQAAGRVIRTEVDRGVIVLIDSRFTQNRYRALYPQAWQGYQAVQDNQRLTELLAAFWNNQG